jgi:hypothetical protein
MHPDPGRARRINQLELTHFPIYGAELAAFSEDARILQPPAQAAEFLWYKHFEHTLSISTGETALICHPGFRLWFLYG